MKPVADPRTGRVSAFFACAPGLEALLVAELRSVGVDDLTPEPGGVEVHTPIDRLATAHVQCGLAIDAWIHVDRFPARHFRQLEQRVRGIAWGDLLPPGTSVRATARSRRSKLFHSRAIEERLVDFIDAPRDLDATVEVRARVVDDVVTLSLGSAGEPLSRRGPRLESGKAPLRADLARALLMLSGWPEGSGPLIDPFCGSGTLLIEGAWMAMRRSPGLDRDFALETFPFAAGRRGFERARERSWAAVRPLERPVEGSDRDPESVGRAQRNLERAGVEARLQTAPLSTSPLLRAPDPSGWWVSNPPYGVRLSAHRELRPLYQAIKERFRALPDGWRLGVVLADPRLAPMISPRLRPRVRTNHGGLSVALCTSP